MLPKMTIGKSLRPLVEGKKVDKWHEYIVGESFLGDGQVGVRDAKYKTIFYCDGPVKVFDLKADPLEMKDLSTSTEGKTVMKKHKKHLREYLSKIELCKQARGDEKQQKVYETYLNYYRKIRKEA
jgi:arylsulfatase A-like enzyme